MTRKEFLNLTAGATALTAVTSRSLRAASAGRPAQAAQPAPAGKPKRGVSIYSYSGLLFWHMTLEDCFAEMNDMGARGLEILANGHIEGYPNPTDEWLEWWQSMLKKYNIVPIEYGHWVDSRRHKGRELTTQESYDMLVRDIKLASKLGFTIGRTKLGVIDRPGTPEYDTLTPVRNWQEFIKMALPVAEQYNFKMCPEIHAPTMLNSKMISEYVDFIQKTNTKYFGLNIDFGVFQTRRPQSATQAAAPAAATGAQGQQASAAGGMQPAQTAARSGMMNMQPSKPEEIVPLLPYVYCCHAKFVDMSEDCEDTTTPYREVIDLMIKNKWDGYLLSEYEGASKDVPGYVSEQLRRQHVMLKKLLGEVA